MSSSFHPHSCFLRRRGALSRRVPIEPSSTPADPEEVCYRIENDAKRDDETGDYWSNFSIQYSDNMHSQIFSTGGISTRMPSSPAKPL